MPAASLLHLLPNVPQASGPDPSQIISATSPNFGNVTTRILDPAAPGTPLIGANQVIQYAANAWPNNAIAEKVVFGRFLTKPLPAQTVSTGTWKLAGSVRATATGTGVSFNAGVSGFCVGQWRPGAGLVARAIDTPGTGFQDLITTTSQWDMGFAVAIGPGSALTLLANDCLILEVWGILTPNNGNSGTATLALLLGGLGQTTNGTKWAYGAMTDTDATLLAPAPITFS